MAQRCLDVRDGAPLGKLGESLRGDITELLAEVSRLLRPHGPDYAEFLDDGGPDVADAATAFVDRLLETAGRGLANLPPAPLKAEAALQAVFEQIGRVQCMQGRELVELLSAYRVGAHAAWRHVSAAALRLDLPADVLASLGDAVFIFVDELGSASADGYLECQSQSVAERERLRHELADLLLCNRSDTPAVQFAADRAGWPLPREAALVLVNPSDDVACSLIERLDHRRLPVRAYSMFGAIVPGPLRPATKDQIARAVRGAKAVVGQSVPLEEFPASARVARLAMELQQRGVLDGDPVFVGDHLDTIIVHGEKPILDSLRAEVLRPLAQLPPATRARLTETLRSWLRHMGDRRAIADELFIHPQTVRYRMSQLQELFGATLDSPRSRAQMMLTLEWGHDS